MAAVLKPRHGYHSLCLGARRAGLSTALVVEGSGPGPDASKQLAARDGDLSAVQHHGTNQHSLADVASPLSLNMSPPLIIVVLLNL